VEPQEIIPGEAEAGGGGAELWRIVPATVAALMKESEAMQGKRVGLTLSGSNIDTDKLTLVLTGGVPRP
jgi:hypothetical protein